jgi:O-glycosyl hydrolase
MYKVMKMAGVLGVVFAIFALVGCELDNPNKRGETQKTDNSIVITKQTDQYVSFYVNPDESLTDPITLSVTVTTNGSSAPTYQWYENTSASNIGGTKIDGAAKSNYTVTKTAEGEYFYYAVITLTNGEKTVSISSSPITVSITATEDVASANTVTVDLGKKQYVRGFGGMSTPWDNAPDDNLDDFEVMFNPEKLGYNISRIMIPPDNTDIDEMMRAFVANETRFSGSYFYTNAGLPERNKDNSTYYEKVKIVNKYGGYVLASPWSPPAEWKTTGSVVGADSRLKPANYVDFADYLRRYSELMGEKGAPIYSVSLQNEFTYPPTDYEGCNYSSTEHVNWWKAAGDFLDGVKGWGGGMGISKVQAMSGESHNQIDALSSVLDNAEARGYIDLYGRHIYGAGVTAESFKNKAQNHPTDPVEIWMSEHNINSGSAGYVNDSTWNYVWQFMNDIDLTIRLNDENAFIWWTAKRFYSMIGDATNGTTDGAVLPRGYGLSHFAKFAKESGRVGVTVEGAATGVNPSGYANNNTGPKISAFVTLKDDFYAKPVETRNARWKDMALTIDDITAISLVMYTPTNNSGGSGTNMQTVKIQLPDGFKIRSATAMRSNSGSPAPIYEAVKVGNSKDVAYVELPASTILSVRFTK